MYDYQKIIILLANLLSTCSPWVLNSTHTQVIPNLSDDVTLRCHCEHLENPVCTMDQLTRIRLLKRSNTGNTSTDWIAFAEISEQESSRVKLAQPVSLDMIASGRLGTSDESFLSVTWPTAYDDVIGDYQCEVDGFGGDLRSDVHLITRTASISRLVPTTTDLLDMMMKMKQDIQAKIEDNFLEVRHWPTGNYNLLSPVSGCPDTPYTKMVSILSEMTSETKDKPNNLLSFPNHLHPDLFERCDHRNVFRFRFCRNPGPDDQVVVLWPKGSYCIHMYHWPNCPTGFKNGYITAFINSSSELAGPTKSVKDSIYIYSKYADFIYCCREDGHSNHPILLPSQKPFYLYRYKGQCQMVKNMDVSEEWILLDTNSGDKYYNEINPDSELNDFVIKLCYYTRRNGR